MTSRMLDHCYYNDNPTITEEVWRLQMTSYHIGKLTFDIADWIANKDYRRLQITGLAQHLRTSTTTIPFTILVKVMFDDAIYYVSTAQEMGNLIVRSFAFHNKLLTCRVTYWLVCRELRWRINYIHSYIRKNW